jgi:hypothetical protein
VFDKDDWLCLVELMVFIIFFLYRDVMHLLAAIFAAPDTDIS